MADSNSLIIFQEKEIRRIWYQEAWWFSVIDVAETLSGTSNPRRYWSDLKRKLMAEGFHEVYEKIVQLKMTSPDGKRRLTDVANAETMFRIVQSIPSPKAEPFKRWFAKVAFERVQEIEDPELGIMRVRELYKAKGYVDDWIEMRLKSIEIRQQLTDEWKGRGVRENIEYSILTAEISRATFGMTPADYKKHKSLKRENLRDHMTNLELIFSMLGEENTKVEAVSQDAIGFEENRVAAAKGGRAAGDALQTFEKSSGRKVVSEANYLDQIASARQKKIEESGKET